MQREFDNNFEIIQVKEINEIKDFTLDKGCYVLIKIYKETNEIGVAICNYENKILKEFRGKRALDLYETIFKYNPQWFTELSHAAYLGKELNKAETALKEKKEYYQE
jgi:tetrahydromethanopterin S-methyltransferase subunit A